VREAPMVIVAADGPSAAAGCLEGQPPGSGATPTRAASSPSVTSLASAPEPLLIGALAFVSVNFPATAPGRDAGRSPSLDLAGRTARNPAHESTNPREPHFWTDWHEEMTRSSHPYRRGTFPLTSSE
jgi:hypothetical protein